MSGPVRYEREGEAAILTLSRPEKLNAFNRAMLEAIVAAVDEADADDAVRALIVTGEGRAFCAGADLDGPEAFTAAKVDPAATDPEVWADVANRDGGGLVALRLFKCLKPVIAAVNGAAVGVGATMTLPMDMRIAAEGARFGFVFCRRGIVPEAASSWFLPRVVGVPTALDWAMSGRIVDAEEARAAGLVRDVVPKDELMSAALAAARRFAEGTAPVSVALTRQMIWRMAGAGDPMEAHRVDSRAIAARAASADAAEGIASFLEKRPAAFGMTVSRDMPGFFPWWEDAPWA